MRFGKVAVNDFIDQNASLFQKGAESLDATQIGFLKALTDGIKGDPDP